MIFLWHVICWSLMPFYGFRNICRVILAPKDDLAPFDLRAQILRVNVELSVHYRGQKIFSKICRVSYFEHRILHKKHIFFATSHYFSSTSRITLIMSHDS